MGVRLSMSPKESSIKLTNSSWLTPTRERERERERVINDSKSGWVGERDPTDGGDSDVSSMEMAMMVLLQVATEKGVGGERDGEGECMSEGKSEKERRTEETTHTLHIGISPNPANEFANVEPV